LIINFSGFLPPFRQHDIIGYVFSEKIECPSKKSKFIFAITSKIVGKISTGEDDCFIGFFGNL